MIKKCNWCEETTGLSREEFDVINWKAVQFGKDKMVCGCPKHRKEMMDYIMEKSGVKKATRCLQALKSSQLNDSGKVQE